MVEFLSTLASRYSLGVTQRGDGWQLLLPDRGTLRCQLDIGPSALDWYAMVNNVVEEGAAFTNWMDYLGYDDTTEDELIIDKQKDITWFVLTWMDAEEVRIIPRKRGFLGLGAKWSAEWCHQGHWRPIQLCDPHSD